ncbi:hypothetical protein HPB52_023305 [Rhipicephalus sanguineus]|uniref:THAP-type domain-containing protein n=1 Tax=Rhipicephalus sanguineus TaxID=34632 RepID=A0A9D4TBX3_RHISA|nr:hypothetical protein HPB52_023305 [Rhipicephalus sanguineus]
MLRHLEVLIKVALQAKVVPCPSSWPQGSMRELAIMWNQLGCPAPDKVPYRCVPRCKSSSKQRMPGISFHEIPSDPELRAKWLNVISRDDWTPDTTSRYSTVCSRHFGSSDFKEGCKIRKLKKDAVPSIFEEYPAYLQPPKNREATSL